jgi:transcriptional regulator with XRE-family HTH domain
MDIAVTIGERIRFFRRAKKMTQARLAEAVGRSDDAISQFERGLNVPSVETLIALSRTFSVPVDALLTSGRPGEVAGERKDNIEQANAVLSAMSDQKVRLSLKLLRLLNEDSD